MKIRDAPCAAMTVAFFNRKHDRRSVKFLRDTRSGEADDTLMPAFAGHDDEMLSVVRLRLRQSKLGYLLLHLLPLAVAAVENAGELSCLDEILLLKKLD